MNNFENAEYPPKGDYGTITGDSMKKKDYDFGEMMPTDPICDGMSWLEARSYCRGWNDYRAKVIELKNRK